MTATLAPPPPPQTSAQKSRVERFIDQYCVHTNGEWIGRRFRLLDWQRAVLRALFAVRPDGLRQHRWALIGVPKKNGKTELAAAIALYLLIADKEPAAVIVCAAASDEQADLVFGAAKTMCELSPPLKSITERYDKEILVPSSPGSRLKRVAAVAGTNDGQNLHAVICDELHEWVGPKGENVWNVLTNGTGARRQPLVLQITTAGYDLDGTICGRQYQYGQRVASREVDDPQYYFHWREAPEGLDYRSPEAWAAANPSYGTLVHEPFFRDQLSKKPESVFRRYFLNQWTATELAWLPFGAWDACLAPELDLDPKRPLRVGIDMAYSNDCAAVVGAQRQDDRTVIRLMGVWENPYPASHQQHLHWKINPFEVEQKLREIREQYPLAAGTREGGARLPGPEFCYDPAWFQRSAPVLEGDGLNMVEFPQTDTRMIPAAQTLYQLISEGKLAHDGNAVLKRHIENAVADRRPRGWRLTKQTAKRKIDAAIATAIACYRAQELAPKLIYEGRDLLVLG